MLAAILMTFLPIPPDDFEPIGRLTHPAIAEASGLVASRRYPGIFWVHNDSGNPPAIFAVKKDGSLVREFAVAAPNVDWEDVAIDDAGHLYLGDLGNNGLKLPIRAIHRLDEPDPNKPAVGPLAVSSTFYRFESTAERFDAEGFYLDGKRAILISKRKDGKEADLFAVPLDPPSSLLRPAKPEKVGTLAGFVEPATGAALSIDRKRLAVCALTVARVYEKGENGRWTPIGEARYKGDQIEAVAWDGADLILAGEGRGIYRIAESRWRKAEKARP